MLGYASSLGHPARCHHVLVHRYKGHLCEFVVMIMWLPISIKCPWAHTWRFGSSLWTLPMYLSYLSSPNNIFSILAKGDFLYALVDVLGTLLQNGYVSWSSTQNSAAIKLHSLWTRVLAPFLVTHQWMEYPFLTIRMPINMTITTKRHELATALETHEF